MNTQEFDLNIIPDSAPVVVHVDQYDHGVGRLVASLYDDETPYAPEGASVYVQGTKPDGKFFVRSTGVAISGNVVTADLAEVMTQVAGRTRMQFVVTEPSGRTGTFVFWLDVQLSALPPDSEMSESDISMVEEAIEQMQDLASDAAESAQEAAGFAQNSSDSAEDSEAWAVGTRNGEAVTPGDPTYHNNSKWYAEHGGGAGGGHTIVNSEGQDMPQRNALQFKGMNVTDDALNDMTIVEGGSGGSTIEVTTSESSLMGEDVTVSDGTNTWTAEFDNSGKAVFSGITSTGTLTVSATDGSETAQYILTAPYFGKYAVTLAFWSATINVTTTTTQLNGKTVYAKKNGVVMGSGVFSNGSASITVPEAGSYTLEVTLSWKTYQSSPINVTAETTYSATLNGFIAPISLSTPTSEFYGQDISVTCDGTAVPGTSFDDSGAASFTALQAGTYVFIVTYNGEPYTATVIVTSETSYSAVINMFTATINVTTPSSSLYGQTITIKKDGTQVGTSQFDNTGAASITVHDTGAYVFEATYDGYTFASDPVNVTAETTYSVTISAGLSLSAWITAGSTTDYPLNPSSYADFSALEADEAAVRQLMTVHNAVDYLAQATAGDTLMQSVINSDICAKWINLSDYALDTLSANADIKSVMDEADKYGYGEWVYDGTSWGPKGNVPIMTANNAPYGVASAYQVFDGNASTSASGTDFSYQSVNPICVKKFECSVNGGTLQGSNDGSTYTDISDPSSNTTYYMYHRVHFASSQTVYTLQFYGRELPVKQASAPTDGREYIQIGSDYYTENWGEKEFNSTAKWIYDHGVELVTLEDNTTGNYVSWNVSNSLNELYATVNKTASGQLLQMAYDVASAIDVTNYTSLNVKIGSRQSVQPFTALYSAKTLPQGQSGTAYVRHTALLNTLDISSVSGSLYLLIYGWSLTGTITGDWSISELWLE